MYFILDVMLYLSKELDKKSLPEKISHIWGIVMFSVGVILVVISEGKDMMGWAGFFLGLVMISLGVSMISILPHPKERITYPHSFSLASSSLFSFHCLQGFSL